MAYITFQMEIFFNCKLKYLVFYQENTTILVINESTEIQNDTHQLPSSDNMYLSGESGKCLIISLGP